MNDAGAFDQLHPVIQHHVVNTLGWQGLRPLQAEAVSPLVSGSDALLLAPTAGGKTEAALLPILSAMERQAWSGLSVLYVCPLKALLNNLEPRVAAYAGWLGRTASIRHGDTGAGARTLQTRARPDILMTTPESLEAMLVSRLVDAPRMFGDVRTVIVDEVHAFAGDDRGWHLLAVLERVADLSGRHIQRVGLSATVGNAADLLTWLQGPSGAERRGAVIAPPAVASAVPELVLDHVGNVRNAATVISLTGVGEKRLVFADSRRTVEDLAVRIRDRGTDTFVSHSSLSLDERGRAERAFAEARDCVIVSTSTLELGIDVGDLDRVVQIGAPSTVASMLQRLGRTGRRSGSGRNMTFLSLDDAELMRAAGLLLLHSEGFVEPVTPPPEPRHVASQQMVGRTLQKGRVLLAEEAAAVARLGLCSHGEATEIAQWLVDTGHLDEDSALHFIGPTAERKYGARHFMELLAVFTASPEVTVLHGRSEIGSVDPTLLTTKVQGPRIIALAGKPWVVTHIDWRRKRAYVEPSDQVGRSRWTGEARAYTYELSDAIRRVLLGEDPSGVHISERAAQRLAAIRETFESRVSASSTVVADDGSRMRWWTFAGARANAVLVAALGSVAPDLLDEWSYSNLAIALRSDATAARVALALRKACVQFGDDLAGVTPEVSPQALKKLKFSELLPHALAVETMARRASDHPSAATVARSPIR
ncbi:DEAD/DEAH box helicase [Nostocoides sp. Soil756]|uniref:DEAD/DEAH box helicase n=1 Tax=Nostocoides sp. Soil756 TaxID=1736399 RepID=UPI00070062C0|nr:DEAD/DEAH box helicase [Tetrasphaera sp. Soil756]KRE61580.1 ATP-dependent helicase [Tetrasphaera sp. Soil756]